MTIRTSTKTVTFKWPFFLSGFNEVLPAGAYTVETDEELLEGISFPAYRRILTVIHLHAKPGHPGLRQILTIDPNELDAALSRDQEATEYPISWGANHKKALKGTISRRERADSRAIELGEDEGMTVDLG